MKQHITLEDLLLFLYGEADFLQQAYIQRALKTDEALRKQLEELKMGQQQLEVELLMPETNSIDNILAYSQCGTLE